MMQEMYNRQFVEIAMILSHMLGTASVIEGLQGMKYEELIEMVQQWTEEYFIEEGDIIAFFERKLEQIKTADQQ